MGIDHSNPYIHSTTVLCDNMNLPEIFQFVYLCSYVQTQGHQYSFNGETVKARKVLGHTLMLYVFGIAVIMVISSKSCKYMNHESPFLSRVYVLRNLLLGWLQQLGNCI